MRTYAALVLSAWVGAFTSAYARENERPNILFCIADDASFPHFGANGCSWVKTPNFDRLAAEGIRFSQAYTPNPKCAPSRSVIITGRNPWQLEAAANHYPVVYADWVSRPF
jgi:arylsulfatase A-like enzyme